MAILSLHPRQANRELDLSAIWRDLERVPPRSRGGVHHLYQIIPNISIATGVSAASKMIVPMAPQIDVSVLCVMKTPPFSDKTLTVTNLRRLASVTCDQHQASAFTYRLVARNFQRNYLGRSISELMRLGEGAVPHFWRGSLVSTCRKA